MSQNARPEHKNFLLAYAKIQARACSLNAFCLILFSFITESGSLKSDNTIYIKNKKVTYYNNNNNNNNNNKNNSNKKMCNI